MSIDNGQVSAFSRYSLPRRVFVCDSVWRSAQVAGNFGKRGHRLLPLPFSELTPPLPLSPRQGALNSQCPDLMRVTDHRDYSVVGRIWSTLVEGNLIDHQYSTRIIRVPGSNLDIPC